MNRLIALLLCAGTIASGCAAYGPPPADSDQVRNGAHEPVDRNRNSVPDNLERKAVPLEPIVDRATPPAE